jgi:hypothetical protein
MDGRAKLMELYEKTGKGQQFVTYKGITIKRLLLKTCSRYYKIALDKYFGDIVLARIASTHPKSLAGLLTISAQGEPGESIWVDVGGLLCSKNRIDALAAAISSGTVTTNEQVYEVFESIQAKYSDDEWNWFLVNYRKMNGKDLKEESKEGMLLLVDRWHDASLKLLNMVVGDISKEFEGDASTGFGIDGNREADFEAVRGSFADNKYVVNFTNEMNEVRKKCESTKSLINSMKG